MVKYALNSTLYSFFCFFFSKLLHTNYTHPADDLEETLWQFARLSLQQKNIWIHSKQPQLPVFLLTVESWAIREKLLLNISIKLLNWNIKTQEHYILSWVCCYLTLTQQFKEAVRDVRLHHVSAYWKHCVHGLNEPFIVWCICIIVYRKKSQYNK